MVQVAEVDLAERGESARLVAAAGDRNDILVNNVGAAPAEPDSAQCQSSDGSRRLPLVPTVTA
jgi:short-subunit dehydrogenase